ncbi:MAG: hypothetical protein Q8S27_02670 [Hoeflea sp.]|uniref:hypothetical protein n=1 Tax=Hoeflea sp. TaxID=1940281 RepID=UPI002731C943|nr:hypothetical protein [Hoeflea sp.]MDP2121641.1 hypothetical protein [Hoeflea sp.]MDP3523454.1 hypothetical protein [Hoeflea sp.]MDZ7603269.1 hypothetical protein [Hoeflea sp.]
MRADTGAAGAYFRSMQAALKGLRVYLADDKSPLYAHGLVGQVIVPYVDRLEATFLAWEHRVGFIERFRISRADSGFPVYQNVLTLENDRATASERLAAIPDVDTLKAEMADFILRHKAFPEALQEQIAERLYLEEIGKDALFAPFILPETIRVSINPKNGRPFYVVHWGVFDGVQTLPMVYMATIEDSSEGIARMLVKDGKLNPDVEVPLPVGGLLNPEFARAFDASVEKNGAYSLSPATIAQNIDADFEFLHPKQLRRFVLGPFYSAGVTDNSDRISTILSKVRKDENAWLLTWTLQEVFSKSERPARRGLWSSEPARDIFHIETDDLEAARQGVSAYQKHALVPHDAYQALYASGEAESIFSGFTVHVISGNQVISEV